jgi:hypothetical protein
MSFQESSPVGVIPVVTIKMKIEETIAAKKMESRRSSTPP